MRIALILALVLSSACVSSTATRGEKVAAGATRIVYSAPLVLSGASGIAASTLYGSLTVASLSGPGAEDARNTVLLGLGVGVGVSVLFLAVGLPLGVTGAQLVAGGIDEEQPGEEPAAIRRMMRKTARDVVEEEAEPKVIKRCVEGWDCPVEEE